MSFFMDFENFEKKNLNTQGVNEEGYETDVPGIMADDKVIVGKDEFPVFEVSAEVFTSSNSRKRLLASSDSKVYRYANECTSARPFYIRYTDSQGNQNYKKIK